MFTRYLIALLADLVVINLFAEFWSQLTIDRFSTSLIAAVMLQLLLQLTLTLEHKVASCFDNRQGKFWRFLSLTSAWFVLFASKFVMLGAIDKILGDGIHFAGAMHGVVTFIAVVAGMLVAEGLVSQIHQGLRQTAPPAARPEDAP